MVAGFPCVLAKQSAGREMAIKIRPLVLLAQRLHKPGRSLDVNIGLALSDFEELRTASHNLATGNPQREPSAYLPDSLFTARLGILGQRHTFCASQVQGSEHPNQNPPRPCRDRIAS